MLNKFSSLSLSLCELHQRGGQAGLTVCLPRLPKGGLRRSEETQMLIDLRGDSRG